MRRVSPASVSVWVALSRPCKVTLTIYQGLVDATNPPGDGSIRARAEDVETLKVGSNLHVLVITAKLERAPLGGGEDDDDTVPALLISGTLYSYDLTFTPTEPGANATSLLAEKLLERRDAPDPNAQPQPLAPDEDPPPIAHAREPLGYAVNRLPSFSLPPQDLEKLRIFHASCRKPHGPGRDALAFLDDLIADTVVDADDRPHFLFLTGDQIYADDVAHPLLPHMTALAEEMFQGTPESLPLPAGFGANRIPVDQVHLPAGLRQGFCETCVAFTSDSAASHLLSVGEYAAHYLCSWSNEAWPLNPAALDLFDRQLVGQPRPAPNDPLFAAVQKALYGAIGEGIAEAHRGEFLAHLLARSTTEDGQPGGLTRLVDKAEYMWFEPENLEKQTSNHNNDPDLAPTLKFAKDLQGQPANPKSEKAKAFPKFFKSFQKALGGRTGASRTQRERIVEFYNTLPKARRVLANVPVMMIWDDHDITDDWNVSQTWVQNVGTSACGGDVVRNAMTVYALFQDWGNRPEDYEPGGAKAKLTEEIPKLFEPGAAFWPAEAPAGALAAEYAETGEDALPWHFSFDGPDFRGLVLNTRTERRFDGPLTAPNLIPLLQETAGPLARQVPTGPLITDDQVLIVVSPVPALGLPVMEQIGQTIGSAALDFVSVAKGGKRVGATEHDVEAWAPHREGFEDLLRRLAPNRRVVFLSGDVHYGAAASLDYWRGGDRTASHFVQFTSSASKNSWPARAVHVFESFAFVKRLLELHKTVERIGWLVRDPQPVAVDQGTEPPLALLLLTEREPVLLPNYPEHDGWQGLSSTREPDIRWRHTLLRDNRPDADRAPAPVPAPLPSGDLNPNDSLRTYREVLSRHGNFLNKHRFLRSTLWTNNIGRVRFENRVGDFLAIQELYSADPVETDSAPAAIVTQYRAPLRPIFPPDRPELPGDA